MAERFNTLYSLSDNLYLEGFPFVVSAGKLLFDTQTGKALAQLKIKNLSGKNLSALKIKLTCFDVAKHELGDKEFTYLDLNTTANTEFGQKTPVYLPYSETRSFEVNFIEAVYSDGEVLSAPTGSLYAVPSPQSILVFGKELAEEYQLIHGEKCEFIPQKHNSLWICSCGAVNSNKNDTCHNCRNNYEGLSSDASKEVLSYKRKARLDAEEEARKEKIYCEACNTSDLSEKIKLFDSIRGYKDADELCDKAKQKKVRKAKRNKKIAIITTPIVCALIAFWILWANVIKPNMEYNKALDLMNAGNLDEAYGIFTELGNYKDAADKVGNIRLQKTKDQLKSLKVGSYVNFGAYEQDNNISNGKEDVEWLVLEVKDGKALIISKYALDCKPYNTSYTDVTWETCTLRKWLNNDFLGAAFSADEKAMIPTVTVSADKNPYYSTNPGNATRDQVFLLSIPEVNKYFNSDSARQCKPTDYVVAGGAYVSSSNGNCWWWLRSPGNDQDDAAYVSNVGDVSESGNAVSYVSGAVRPALWIDLSEQ